MSICEVESDVKDPRKWRHIELVVWARKAHTALNLLECIAMAPWQSQAWPIWRAISTMIVFTQKPKERYWQIKCCH